MADNEKLYTLTEVSKLTNISMPTLQRYKKHFQDRIPSRGTGRTQRYPEESLEIFRELKKENMKRRGRPRKNASADDRPKTVRRTPTKISRVSSEEGDKLLTLKEIGEQTNISYPTLLRYVKSNLARIPHVGEGRNRKYRPEAVDVFRTLRQESRRGRKASRTPTAPRTTRVRPLSSSSSPIAHSSIDASDLIFQIKELQKSHFQLQRQVQRLEKELQKPFKVTLQR